MISIINQAADTGATVNTMGSFIQSVVPSWRIPDLEQFAHGEPWEGEVFKCRNSTARPDSTLKWSENRATPQLMDSPLESPTTAFLGDEVARRHTWGRCFDSSFILRRSNTSPPPRRCSPLSRMQKPRWSPQQVLPRPFTSSAALASVQQLTAEGVHLGSWPK